MASRARGWVGWEEDKPAYRHFGVAMATWGYSYKAMPSENSKGTVYG